MAAQGWFLPFPSEPCLSAAQSRYGDNGNNGLCFSISHPATLPGLVLSTASSMQAAALGQTPSKVKPGKMYLPPLPNDLLLNECETWLCPAEFHIQRVQ